MRSNRSNWRELGVCSTVVEVVEVVGVVVAVVFPVPVKESLNSCRCGSFLCTHIVYQVFIGLVGPGYTQCTDRRVAS